MVLVLRAPHSYSHLLLKAFSKVLNCCIFLVRKLGFREVKGLAQGHLE